MRYARELYPRYILTCYIVWEDGQDYKLSIRLRNDDDNRQFFLWAMGILVKLIRDSELHYIEQADRLRAEHEQNNEYSTSDECQRFLLEHEIN